MKRKVGEKKIECQKDLYQDNKEALKKRGKREIF
jgi:hypothetical protein